MNARSAKICKSSKPRLSSRRLSKINKNRSRRRSKNKTSLKTHPNKLFSKNS